MLSKKCKYAIHALVYLAERYQDGPVHIQEIAEHERIPKKFLKLSFWNFATPRSFTARREKAAATIYTKNPTM